MEKNYTDKQVELAFEKADVRFADKTNRDIGVGIARELLNDPNHTSASITGSLSKNLRVDYVTACKIVDALGHNHDNGASKLFKDFQAAAKAAIVAISPPPPSKEVTGTCADVRQAIVEGRGVNTVAARYCEPIR